MSQEFRRYHRLLDGQSFSRVFKRPERSRDKYFTVLFRGKDEPGSRLGLAIAKKHCRLATGRNRLKRLIRESYRHHREALAGLDIVVLNTPVAHKVSNRVLSDSLERHWQRCRSGQQQKRKQGN